MEAPRPAPTALRRRVWIAAIAALALIAAGAVTWTVVRDHPAETVVKDFFAALQAKDVDAALALVAESGMPDGTQPHLLVPEAVGDGWELTGTEVEGRETIASVTAEFDTPDGVQHGRYELESEPDGTWTLEDPFVSVRAGTDVIRYLQANDAVTAIDATASTVVLFPGVYRLYPDVPGVVDAYDTRPVALFGDAAFEVPGLGMSPEPEAVASVQQDVHDRIAACLDAAQPAPDDCPFGLLDGTNVTADEGDLDTFTEAEWGLEAYPDLSIPETFRMEPADPDIRVSLTVTGYGGSVETRFTTACAFDFSVWPVVLEAEAGTVALAIDEHRPAGTVEHTTCDTAP